MKLSEFLSRQGMSQTEFGDAIGVTGETVCRYLNGTRFPSAAIMIKIKQATDGRVTPNDLLCAK